jgi:hypothetical protein
LAPRLCVLLFLIAPGVAHAQAGDPPPPPPPLELDESDAEDPAEEGDLPPAPLDPVDDDAPGASTELPEPDPVEPERVPRFEAANPMLGAALAGGAGAAGFAIAVVGTWSASTALDRQGGGPLATLALLAGLSVTPFVAALAAGLVVLPLGRPNDPEQYGQLCVTCGMSYLAAAACLAGGLLLGVGGSGCHVPSSGCGGWRLCGPDGFGPLGVDTRVDAYGAAVGAGLGAIAGPAVAMVALHPATLGVPDALRVEHAIAAAAGGAIGAAAGGAIGAALVAWSWQRELDETDAPPESSAPAEPG